eukprot:scaffold26412_cov19-Tisochrysis_lutea.AAC.3
MVRFGAHHVGGVSTWGATHLVASNSHLCAEQAKGRQAVTASELIQAPKKQTRGRSERKGGAQVCDLSLRTNPRVSTGSCTHMLFSNTAAFLHGWAAEVYLPVGAAQPRQKGLQGLKADRFGRLLRKIVQRPQHTAFTAMLVSAIPTSLACSRRKHRQQINPCPHQLRRQGHLQLLPAACSHTCERKRPQARSQAAPAA